jgi:hypothetical protein
MLFGLLLLSCGGGNDSDDPSGNGNPDASFDWIVSKQDLTGSDNPFPFASNPLLGSIADVSGLSDDETVVLVSFANEVRAYPYKFITPFEVVNDVMDGEDYAITYCPVTESAHNADNSFNDVQFSLIASGFRYKDNLISYDENSGTYWSQMLMKCVRGPFQNQFQQILPMVETSWEVVKTYFPEARVFTPTSVAQKGSSDAVSAIEEPGKDERVLGLLDISDIQDTEIHVFRKSDFNADITLFPRIIGAENTVVVGSAELDFMVAYHDEHGIEFAAVQNEFPVVMIDGSGSKWSVFGVAVSGPRQGERLRNAMGFIGSWWAWEDFYDEFTFVQ